MVNYSGNNSKIKKLIKLLKRLDRQTKGEEKALEAINLWQKQNKTNIATVISAVPLSEDQLQTIEQQLSLMTDDKVLAVNKIDKQILGGLKIIIGSKIIDSTLAGRLQQFEKKVRQFND